MMPTATARASAAASATLATTSRRRSRRGRARCSSHTTRFKQTAPEGITYYFDAFGVHAELFVSGTSSWYDYVGVGGSMLGVRVLHSDNSVTTRYFHKDHLGSLAVITNETGAVVERDSYDAWGKRRFPTGQVPPGTHGQLCGPILSGRRPTKRPTFRPT
jgi:uncharacterized protein RhaS with RHS repeats